MIGVAVGVAVTVAVGVWVGVSVTVLVGVIVGVFVAVPVMVAVGVVVGVPADVKVGVTVGVGDGTGQQSVPGQKSSTKGQSPHGATIPNVQFRVVVQTSLQPALSQDRVPVAQPQKDGGLGSGQPEHAQQQAVATPAVAVDGVATVTLKTHAAARSAAKTPKILWTTPISATTPASQAIATRIPRPGPVVKAQVGGITRHPGRPEIELAGCGPAAAFLAPTTPIDSLTTGAEAAGLGPPKA